MDEAFEPRIVGFLCNWCSYAGADLAGTSRMQYPPNVRIIRLMCSGGLDPLYVFRALLGSCDGVLIAGCHPGDCHYTNGNYKARRRVAVLKSILGELGLDEDRVWLRWISASEGGLFAETIREMVANLKEKGPSTLARSWAL
jgi:F420-non-reducing hydrogenase iron-sulfur subunit